MAKREVPEVGAGSMSDISFLLLTFFLLTSNVDQNKGMARRLPPMAPEIEDEKPPPVKQRNLLLVKVNRSDLLSVNRELTDVLELKERVKKFLVPTPGDESMPEVEDVQIDGLGLQQVSRGVVSLNTDRGTSYKMYMAVQNEIMKAYNEIRDEYSLSKFGKKLSVLSEDEQESVRKKFPLNLSEAEPTEIKK